MNGGERWGGGCASSLHYHGRVAQFVLGVCTMLAQARKRSHGSEVSNSSQTANAQSSKPSQRPNIPLPSPPNPSTAQHPLQHSPPKTRPHILPPKANLHEPHRLIQHLDKYDHLRRVLRLCTNHFLRNIKKVSVSEQVRQAMQSLICMKHKDWDGTLAFIASEGGKAGQGQSTTFLNFQGAWKTLA